MTDGNIDEIKRYTNLSESELMTLRSIYLKRLNHINTEIRKRQKEENIVQISINIMKQQKHCTKIFCMDAERIYNKFIKDTNWQYENRKIPNENLSLAIVNNIYKKYNIEFNPYNIIESYDLDGTQFQILNLKLEDWLNKNYWRR